MRELLRPRLPRLLLAVALGALSLGSALALAGISAWLITRAWQMPPVLDLAVAVVAVRALGISRGVLGYCQRLASHDTALRAAADTRERLYRRLADAPAEAAMRLPSGELVARVGDSVDELSDVLVRAVLPIAVAAVLSVAAVTAIADDVVLAAGIVLTAQALGAMATRDTRLDHYFITGFYPGNQGADVSHNSGNIVTENMRQGNLYARQASTHPDVQMVQGASFHFN